MKLNCDMGESFGSWTMGKDADVMPISTWPTLPVGSTPQTPTTWLRPYNWRWKIMSPLVPIPATTTKVVRASLHSP